MKLLLMLSVCILCAWCVTFKEPEYKVIDSVWECYKKDWISFCNIILNDWSTWYAQKWFVQSWWFIREDMVHH